MANPLAAYRELGDALRKGTEFKSDSVWKALKALAADSLAYTASCKRKNLISQIKGKGYFAFEKGTRLSRPINEALFVPDTQVVERFFDCIRENAFTALTADELTKACYTVAISFCAAVDLQKSGDQKTPGTFFEYLIGHLFARRIGVNPVKQLEVLNLDMKAKLPTDFIFDLGPKKAKFHVPVKTSTRERVVQVWAHQRVLDGVYGVGRFLGVLVCLSETKMDRASLEVIEICLPDQWQVYQLFIGQLKRIYYLDLPIRYIELNQVFPKIHVLPFGNFFLEANDLAS